METNKDAPIHPVLKDKRFNPELELINTGITLRQYYVGLAMNNFSKFSIQGIVETEIARKCVRLADALIEELNKNQ